ncbi:IST1-LIKE 7 [Hibiscus trionum]|uniref:IST1-LIKE 7 n=1 Tax=Hibiscus trionum TaxID=183268 RepID=A0A9W7LGD6_HIBTR|nr:IST1-LIKE 7 [Hibiscus trionum]
MLDGILGRGFASKCKSLIKLIKSRIEVIRRKKTATLKFMKKDVADLLANGLDINAYGRVEGYIAELVLSSFYDFVAVAISRRSMFHFCKN